MATVKSVADPGGERVAVHLGHHGIQEHQGQRRSRSFHQPAYPRRNADQLGHEADLGRGWPGSALIALEQVRQTGSPFALVLLDAMMPEMDGFTLARRIKQETDLTVATLMMLSSANRGEDAARCRELGVAAYLTKPVRQLTLLDAIMTSLSPSVSVVGQAPLAALPPASGEARRTLRFLLAEDNAVNQRLAVSLLEKRGHQVVVVSNGRDAVAALDEGRFDAVLMDVQMPEMDGFEAAAVIRARDAERGGHTPIVAMTAHALLGDRERCLAAGLDAYVAKPLRPHELFEVLEGLVPRAGSAGLATPRPEPRPRRWNWPRSWSGWTGTWSS